MKAKTSNRMEPAEQPIEQPILAAEPATASAGEVRFAKDQLVWSGRLRPYKDVLAVLLDSEQTYTLADAEQIARAYLALEAK